MTKEDQLLMMLDRMYGFGRKIQSKFRKLRQYFDETTNEHVFIIEYRLRVAWTSKSQPRINRQRQRMKLLRQLIAKARADSK